MDVIILIAAYLIVVNCLGFLAMLIDKNKARKHAYRIPESTLFLLCIIGGSIGSILGMHIFHHKTRHWYFLYGMPAILVIQIILLVLLFVLPKEIAFL